MAFDFDWPWIGAVLAVILLGLLFGTALFRTPGIPSRWHDAAWLAVLLIPIYMIHQVEEHGVDLLGENYAFRGSLCAMLGYPDPATCPIPFSFITAVNVGSVWGATLLAAIFGRRRPLVALSAYSIPLVNGFTHIAGAVREQAYNPGLLTGVLVFLPLSLWALVAGRRAGIGSLGIGSIVVAGVLVHAVLMASLLAYLHGAIGTGVLVAVQLVNTVIPLAVVSVTGRLSR